MKILLITHGSRGDVQPFVALAKELQGVGHDVTLAGPTASVGMGEPYCSRVVRLHDGPNVLADDIEVVRGLETKFRGLRGKRHFFRTIRKTRALVRTYLDEVAEMARKIKADGQVHDVVIHHVTVPGHDVAEYLGVPSIVVCPQPYWVATKAFPDPSLPFKIPSFLNRASYITSPLVVWAFAGRHADWRKAELGVGQRRGGMFRQADGSPTTVLHPFTKHLLPDAVDYPSWVHTTGFWYLNADEDWQPPESLATFIDSGSPPICVTFGSSVASDSARLGKQVGEAIRSAGVRAVVVEGWSGLDAADLGESVILTNNIPYDWLFRHVSLVVHHGGMGTTGMVLAAGKPQVVCPSIPDQWFSARRMRSLGIAPGPVAQRRLTADDLTNAIQVALNDPAARAAAHELSTKVRDEPGVSSAVRVIESVVREAAIPQA
ncbi:glycosyltransferase [Phytoactinopolyspora limicola]|uniref:glycosyltransferase n=1 Tax=Phytoactinopolyspora limicola TaxID=2715536 RepID=UPI00140D0045|nr:glycosyltransferase [Phytoactinopolyspora limicola]